MRTSTLIAAGAAVLACLAAGGGSVAWWVAARSVERGALAWIDDQRANGADVAFDALAVDGWPFTLRLTAVAPRYAARGVSWEAGRLTAEAPVWDPNRIALALPAPQRLALAPDAAPPGIPPLALAAEGGGHGRVELGPDGAPVSATLSFSDVTALPAIPNLPATTVATLDLAVTRPPGMPAGAAAAGPQAAGLTARLEAAGIRLPEAAAGPLGPVMDRAALDLRLQGEPPEPDPRALAAWSRAGGTIEIDRMALAWGPAGLDITGTLALDAALQPQAALSAELRGAQAVLSAYADRLEPRQVAAARTVVALLSRPAEPGGEPVLKAPLTLQNRVLSVGPLKLATLPPLRW